MFRSGTQGSAGSREPLYPVVGSGSFHVVDAICGAVNAIGTDGNLGRCHGFGFTVGQAVSQAVRKGYC